MAYFYRCDWCKRESSDGFGYIQLMEKHPARSPKNVAGYDVCDVCQDALRRWVTERVWSFAEPARTEG